MNFKKIDHGKIIRSNSEASSHTSMADLLKKFGINTQPSPTIDVTALRLEQRREAGRVLMGNDEPEAETQTPSSLGM